MDEAFHYPPELLALLVDTIPRLVRSKKDVVVFLRGAGIPDQLMSDVQARVQSRDAITKFEMVRVVLTRINEGGDPLLRARREVVKRVTEFEDFSTCWPNEQLAAAGLVARVRTVVNVKDSFTRMNLERKKEEEARQASARARQAVIAKKRAAISEIHRDLGLAAADANPQRRGTALEGVLNRLFVEYEISIRESFRVHSPETGRVVEQIDGVIELDGHLYLVEMKWLEEKAGVEHVSPHLVRMQSRAQSRGLFISASGYTAGAVEVVRDALQRNVVALSDLDEFVHILERELDLRHWLREKLRIAQVDRQPRVRLNLEKIPAVAVAG